MQYVAEKDEYKKHLDEEHAKNKEVYSQDSVSMYARLDATEARFVELNEQRI